jgi:geranylgeranyl diphosphate synthase, type I
MTVTMPAGVQTARDLTGPAIAGAVSRLSPAVRTVAAYHLGLADASGTPVSSGSTGKALRPALALLSVRAAGATPDRGVVPAAAVELVHNFSLLHDDIMDGDTERRHQPTAWTVYGVGAAILAGDALLALAQDLLLENPPYGVWAARCLSAAVQRLIAGQGADLAFERRNDVTVEECLDIGVVYVGGSANLAMSLSGFGAHAGLSFQLVDDLLGIWGAPQITGKPVGSDLRACKKSVPVVAALTSGTSAGRELAALLAAPEPLTEDEVSRATALVEEAGGKEQVEKMADAELASALSCLADAGMPEDVRAEFAAIAESAWCRWRAVASPPVRSDRPDRRHAVGQRAGGPGGTGPRSPPPDRAPGFGRVVAG